ncbi:MAG: hypothetical protein V4500_05240 [Pseudomonadota bacterium]
MRTPIRLWLLLNFFAVSAVAQVPVLSPASTNSMRVDPAVQRERDSTRMGILQDELAKESREMATAENEWKSAQASRALPDKIQEIAARVTLHRQNVAALAREIALAKSPAIPVARNGDDNKVSMRPQGRQPDDWLIFRPQVPAVDQNVVPNVWLRRRLPLAESGNSRPQWIIPAGFTGIGP